MKNTLFHIKSKEIFFLFLLVISSFMGISQTISNTQVLINYVNPASIKACGANGNFDLTIKNISSSVIAANSIVGIKLPVGVSVNSILSTAYTYDSYVSGSNTYFYRNSVSHSIGQELSISLNLQADCGIFSLLNTSGGESFVVQNEVNFDYSLSGSSLNLNGTTLSYNIAQANIKTTVSAFNQTITIPNDYSTFVQEVRYDVTGNSNLSSFNLQLTVPSQLVFQQIQSLKVNGVTYTGYANPILISGSTYGTTLNASSLGLPNFNSGDVILITYKFKPSCLTTVQINYTTSIDCHGSNCSFDDDYGFVNLIQGPPLVTSTITNTSLADFCGNKSTIQYVFSNNDPLNQTVYNPQIYLELSSMLNYSNFKVNGISVVSGLPTSTTGVMTIQLKNLQNSSGYILHDYNGDGVFGEIGTGETFIFTYDVAINTTLFSNCTHEVLNSNIIASNFRYYQTNCIINPNLILGPYFTLSYNNFNFIQPTITSTGSFNNGQSQTLKLCVDRQINETVNGGSSNIILDQQFLFGSNISLPCGLTLQSGISSYWENASGVMTEVGVTSNLSSGNITTVSFQAIPGQIPLVSNHIKGCLVLNTQFNCLDCFDEANWIDQDGDGIDDPTESFSINWNGFGLLGNCTTQDTWACKSLVVCESDCIPTVDCSLKGQINNTDFTVKRTSFGWTDATMTTLVTQADVNANPSNYNVYGAYACDVVNVNLKGNICGGADDFTPYVTFSKPTAITTSMLTLSNATLKINGISNPISLFSIVDFGSYFELKFNSQTGPFINGTTLELDANFNVSKPVVSSTPFPNYLNSIFKGAFFTNTAWVNGASPILASNISFATNQAKYCLYPHQLFSFYKVEEKSVQQAGAVNCGVNEFQYVFGLGYQGGTGGDEFPNEFRPFNSFNGNLVFQLTNPLNVGNVYVVAAQLYNPELGYISLNVNQVGDLITISPVSGVWPVIDKLFSSRFYYIKFKFNINCGSTVSVSLFENQIYSTKYLYSSTCSEPSNLSITQTFPVVMPNITYSFINPIQSSTSSFVNFDVNTTNNSSFASNYPWMLITYDPTLVSVTVPSAPYFVWSPTQIYVKTGLIGSNSFVSDVIKVTPLVCDVEQTTNITVESGYHCAGYPAVMGTWNANDHCVKQTDILQLTILKSNLNVDLFKSFSTTQPVSKCSGEFSVIIQAYDDQKANITDLSIQSNAIPGLTLVSASYMYPIAQGNNFDPGTFSWSMVTPTSYTNIPSLTASALQSGFTFNNIGLDASATLKGILANDGVNLYNFYKIKLDYVTSCEFDEAQQLTFNIDGTSNCNEPINTTTSTFIDVKPPLANLNVTMNISDDGCDGIVTTNDITVQVVNNETVMQENLIVNLYCDTDNDGLFNESLDTYLGQNPVMIGTSHQLLPGQTSTVLFNSGMYAPCSSGSYLAVLSDVNGCKCEFNYVNETLKCCNCPEGIDPVSTSVFTLMTPLGGGYRYKMTNYPLQIRNLTNNPNDPILYVYNMDNDAWAKPENINYAGNCNYSFNNLTVGDEIIFKIYSNYPHNLESRLVYPMFNENQELCFQDPICMLVQKNMCPHCEVYLNDNPCTSSTSIVVNSSASIMDLNLQTQINIYPNPFENKINITSPVLFEKIEIVDDKGRLVYKQDDIETTSYSVDGLMISSGVYFCKVYTLNGQIIITKLTK